MKISEILFFNIHGDVIMKKRYRDEIPANTSHIVSHRIQDVTLAHLPPHFIQDGIHYMYIKRAGLVLCAVCREATSSVCVTHFLDRLCNVLKDFCGTISEQSIKANIFLIQEILDQVVIEGYVQLTSSDKLRPYVQSEARIVQQPSTKDDLTARLFGIESRAVSSSLSSRPLVSKIDQHQNDIFVDVIERLTATVNTQGVVRRLEVDGSVNLKVYVPGTPQVHVSFNDDLTFSSSGHSDAGGFVSGVHLENCHFHPGLDRSQWDRSQTVSIQPPQSETTLISYLLTRNPRLTLPFRVQTSTKCTSASDTELSVTIDSQFPVNVKAVNVTMHIPTYPHITEVAQRLAMRDHTAEFVKSQSEIRWFVKEFLGMTCHQATFRLMSSLGSHKPTHPLPLTLEFEISGYTCSGLQVRHIRVSGGSMDSQQQSPPKRWIRYITVSESYIYNIAYGEENTL